MGTAKFCFAEILLKTAVFSAVFFLFFFAIFNFVAVDAATSCATDSDCAGVTTCGGTGSTYPSVCAGDGLCHPNFSPTVRDCSWAVGGCCETYCVSIGKSAYGCDGSICVCSDLPSPDTTPPNITLSGSNPMEVIQGSVFKDPGATAIDDTDGDITSKIVVSGIVNTAVLGIYTLTYNVSDEAGNEASPVSRTVNVVSAPAPPVPDEPPGISLTVDPLTVKTDIEININVVGTDDKGVVALSVDFGDGSAVEVWGCSVPFTSPCSNRWTRSYETPGDYTIKVWSTDTNARDSITAAQKITITASAPIPALPAPINPKPSHGAKDIPISASLGWDWSGTLPAGGCFDVRFPADSGMPLASFSNELNQDCADPISSVFCIGSSGLKKWKARACADCGAWTDCGPWGSPEPWKFTVVGISAPPPELPTDSLRSPLKFNTIQELLNAIINFIFWLGLALAPIIFIIAGFMFITSIGSPQRLDTAKRMILYAVIGLAVVLLAKGLIIVVKSI